MNSSVIIRRAALVLLVIAMISLNITAVHGPFRLLDLSVVAVAFMTTAGYRFWAVIVAVTAGLLQATLTVFPVWLYLAAYVGVVIVTSLVIQRIVAERAVASFVTACIAGSVMMPLMMLVGSWLNHLFDPASLLVPVRPWIINGVWQIALQPIVIWIWWRWSGGGQFARLHTASNRPF